MVHKLECGTVVRLIQAIEVSRNDSSRVESGMALVVVLANIVKDDFISNLRHLINFLGLNHQQSRTTLRVIRS